jgi:formylmethanofuran dehydrogenase subunit E
MLTKATLLGLFALMAVSLADSPIYRMPQPRYERKDSDPAWLESAVRLHGHLGPSVIAGTRLGIAGIKAVEAKGYFDVEVTCEGPFAKPPQSCFLDGLQAGTGATMGKRNLIYIEAEKVVVRVKNTETGKTAELHPTPEFLKLSGLLQSPPRPEDKPAADASKRGHDDDSLGKTARKIATMEDKELFTIEMK